MRVNQDVVALREFGHFSQQLTGAADRETRRKAAANAAISQAVPFPDQLEGLVNRGPRLFLKLGRDALAFVHHALADRRPKSAFFDHAQNLFGMTDRFHRERAGRPTLNHFRDADLRRSANRFARVRGFHRPNSLF